MQKQLYVAAAVITTLVTMLFFSSWEVEQREQARFQALRYAFEPISCAMKELDCKIPIVVTNPTAKPLKPIYVDTGGGPLAEVTYNVVIYDKNNVQCFGAISDFYGYEIQPQSSKQSALLCTDGRPENMERPAAVKIYGQTYRLQE